MANYLGNELSGWIAAIAPVEGGFLDWGLDKPQRGMPVLIIHNRYDKMVAYSSGADARDRWIKWNGCDSTAQTRVFHPDPEITEERYGNGRDGSEIYFYTFHHQKADGHVSPGEVRWTFFRKHSLSEVPSGEPDFPAIRQERMGETSESEQLDETGSAARPFLVTVSEPGWQVVEAEHIGWRIDGEASVFELEGTSGGKLLAIWDARTSVECAFEASSIELYAFSHEGRADYRTYIDGQFKTTINNSDMQKVCEVGWSKTGRHTLRIVSEGIVGVDYIRLRAETSPSLVSACAAKRMSW